MRASLPLLICIVALGCSDVTTRFDTLAEAEKANAFARGWLPPLLPKSSKDIVQRNDLDINRGAGSFNYSTADHEEYVESLKAFKPRIEIEGSNIVVTLETNSTVWAIKLNPAGQATYEVNFLGADIER